MVKTEFVDWDPVYRQPFVKEVVKTSTVNAFIQASISEGFEDKLYADVNGVPLLWHTINKAKQCKFIDKVIVISPNVLPELPENIEGFVWFKDEEDVLGRYAAASKQYPSEYIVRLTSDCPLLDSFLIDHVVNEGIGFDYASNVMPSTFPEGLDVEMISRKMLVALDGISNKPFDRKHVTTYLRNNLNMQADMKILNIQSMHDYSYLKLSVDTQEDLDYIRRVDKELCQVH